MAKQKKNKKTGKKSNQKKTPSGALPQTPANSTSNAVARATWMQRLQRGAHGYGVTGRVNFFLCRRTGLEVYLSKKDYDALGKIVSKDGFRLTQDKRYGRFYPEVRIPDLGWVSLGRYLLGLQKGDKRVCHYLNGDPRDCTRENIRVFTRAELAQHRRKGNSGSPTSEFRGVKQQKNGRWKATITNMGYTKSLGTYDTELDAAVVRDHAVTKVFGKCGRYCALTTKAMYDYVCRNDVKLAAKIDRLVSSL